jgi:hypothetical protein
MPVVQSVGSPLYVFWCITASFAVLAGTWLAAAFSIGFSWLTFRQSLGWIRTLPVQTRALLLTFAVPMMTLCAVAQFASFHIARLRRAPLPPSAQIIEFGGLFGWLMMIWLLYALLDWRPFRRMGKYAGVALLIVGTCIPLVGCPLALRHHGYDPLHKAVLNLATSFPGGWGAAVLLVIFVLPALWWMLEKVVSQSEYADAPRNAKLFE